ncbi:DUF805 domain-containing protein [Desulfuromonas soudanensis]|uniref:DUF805 domain-containing protein n=1 Tax=Desulfuromonas soudanensis TaxID=1603606 RepID=UPI0009E71A4F|nr:DUF805 domain-containing protein [Desulfuromonas soudanensis]
MNIKTVFGKMLSLTSIHGRTSRKNYLVFFYVSIAVTVALVLLLPDTDNSFVFLILWLPIYWIAAPSIITIKRFHDIGLSGKSIFVTTIISIILFVIICFFLVIGLAAGVGGGNTTFPAWFFPLFLCAILAFIGVVGRNVLICLRPGQEDVNAYGESPK